MKKFFAVTFALMMLMSVSSATFAAEPKTGACGLGPNNCYILY